MTYFSGGMLILSIALSFFLTASDTTSKTIATVFLCLVFVWLLVILVIVFYWKSKRKSLENISKSASAEGQRKAEEIQQRSKVGWFEKADEEERQRAIKRYENLKKENEAQKKLEAKEVQRQKAKQDTATCKELLEQCGMQFFIEYYPQLKRLPIPDITVSDHYFPERQVRLTAAKKIVDSGLTECALCYITETFGDIFSGELIDRAKSILNELENKKGETK